MALGSLHRERRDRDLPCCPAFAGAGSANSIVTVRTIYALPCAAMIRSMALRREIQVKGSELQNVGILKHQTIPVSHVVRFSEFTLVYCGRWYCRAVDGV